MVSPLLLRWMNSSITRIRDDRIHRARSPRGTLVAPGSRSRETLHVGGPRPGMSLVGRAAEWGEVERLLARARNGMSGALLVRGEAGVGKTCLLDAAVASATDFDVVRVVGIESEMQLGFAGVHQLLTPFFDRIE